MQKYFAVCALYLLMAPVLFSQDRAIVSGLVTENQTSKIPIPFANVFVKESKVGTTTDFDGRYTLDLPIGKWTLVFSFLGYQTEEVALNLQSNGERIVVVDQKLSIAKGFSLDEVVVKSTAISGQKEVSMLQVQKEASMIKEVVGSERLVKTGASNAAVAAQQISGVSRSEGSGDLFIRGLGDRYRFTSINRLPVPSDDVTQKNIDLGLFSTGIISNVALLKTYNAGSYADQSSGGIDITTRSTLKKTGSASLSSGLNSKVIGSNMRNTIMMQNVSLGLYRQTSSVLNNITEQSWSTQSTAPNYNYGGSISGSHTWELSENTTLTGFGTLRQKSSSRHREGIFKSYRSNVLRRSFTDAEIFSHKVNTTGLLRLGLYFNNAHKISYNFIYINTLEDRLFEQGRNGEGYVFDQDPKESEAFVRDQNLKQTRITIQQLSGKHTITDANKILWGLGLNRVSASEPNRIHNEVNIFDKEIRFAHVGGFQQRKSSQYISDTEYCGYLENTWSNSPSDDKKLNLTLGGNFRNKSRNFKSLFAGVRALGVQVRGGVDDFHHIFNSKNFDNNRLTLKKRPEDTYNSGLSTLGFYGIAHFNLGVWSGSVGLRYEVNRIDVRWDVANYPGRIGTMEKDYQNLLPSLNIKYAIDTHHALRVAASQTISMPEMKELSPFYYESPTGRVTQGNPDLERSDVYNLDLKWEWFPQSDEMVSLSSFYKHILQPINSVQTNGSSGYFYYENTGETARIYGLELEGRWNALKYESGSTALRSGGALTRMWVRQDLKDKFQYKDIKTAGLQGASQWIFNVYTTYTTDGSSPFQATLSANYTSDKIMVLGGPEDFSNRSTLYNDEIIEKGFVSVNMVLSQQLGSFFKVSLAAKNLLNPDIIQTQKIRNIQTGMETQETVRSYQNGMEISLSMNFSF